MGYGTPALYWVHDVAIHSVLPISSVGVLQFLKKYCTCVALIVFLKASDLAQPNFFGPPLIPRVMFLLYPHFAMIFGSDKDSIFFNCLLVKKVCPSMYSNSGLHTPWYNINASCCVTFAVNIDSDVVIAVLSDTGNCLGYLISSGSFQCPKFFCALPIFLFEFQCLLLFHFLMSSLNH